MICFQRVFNDPDGVLDEAVTHINSSLPGSECCGRHGES